MHKKWKVGQKVKTPKGLVQVIAVRDDGTAAYSLIKNNKGELEQGFHGSLPPYHFFEGSPEMFNISLPEDDTDDLPAVTVEDYLEDRVLYETAPCIHCGNKGVIKLSREQLDAWKHGTHIQDAFPDESEDVREQIKTGIHPECWEAMFGGMD